MIRIALPLSLFALVFSIGVAGWDVWVWNQTWHEQSRHYARMHCSNGALGMSRMEFVACMARADTL